MCIRDRKGIGQPADPIPVHFTVGNALLDRLRGICFKPVSYTHLIAGRISEQNFNTMLEKTQTEQTELKTKVSEGRKRLSDEVQLANDAKQWVCLLYTARCV